MARPARRVQEVFKISRVGSDRVGSDEEVVEISRTGAVHPDPTRPDLTPPARFDLTREQPWYFEIQQARPSSVLFTSWPSFDKIGCSNIDSLNAPVAERV